MLLFLAIHYPSSSSTYSVPNVVRGNLLQGYSKYYSPTSTLSVCNLTKHSQISPVGLAVKSDFLAVLHGPLLSTRRIG